MFCSTILLVQNGSSLAGVFKSSKNMGDSVHIRDLVAQFNVSPTNVCSSIDIRSVAGQLGWPQGMNLMNEKGKPSKPTFHLVGGMVSDMCTSK